MGRCAICGGPESACQEEWLAGLVRLTGRGVYQDVPGPMGEWRSKERVYAVDPVTGSTYLAYAVGDPVPEDEARRQGLLEGKAKPEPEEHKAVTAPPATKSRPPRRQTKGE